jgi:hypothetical protein
MHARRARNEGVHDILRLQVKAETSQRVPASSQVSPRMLFWKLSGGT